MSREALPEDVEKVIGDHITSVEQLKYWKRTRDRLFAIFALAFALLAVERTVLASVSASQQDRHWIYVARLLAFLLIILGVIDKNRLRRRGG